MGEIKMTVIIKKDGNKLLKGHKHALYDTIGQ